MLFLEIDNYSAVNAGTPADPRFPRFMSNPSSTVAGSAENPLPLISAAPIGTPLSPGEVFTLELGGGEVHVEVREARASFPTMAADRPIVVADIRHLDSLVGPALTRPTVMYIRADPTAIAELAELMSTQTLSAVLTAQAAELEEVRDDRFTSGLDRTLLVTFWLATSLAAVAAASSLVQSSRARRRDFGHLRTQGLTSRQALWLTVIEHLPPIVVASVVGALAGVGIAAVLEPAINVSAFTSSQLDLGLSIDPRPIALATSGVLAFLVVVTGIFGYATRREDLSMVIRGGE